MMSADEFLCFNVGFNAGVFILALLVPQREKTVSSTLNTGIFLVKVQPQLGHDKVSDSCLRGVRPPGATPQHLS